MVTVEVDPVRVESRLAAGEIGYPRCGDGVLAPMGSCPFSMDRRVGGFASSAAGSVPQLSGDARVVASDRVAAQSVCGGADLGCIDRPLKRGRASPDRREPGGAGGDGAGLAAPRSAAAGGDAGVVPHGRGDRGGGREDPGHLWLCVAGRAGRGGDRDRGDQVPVRTGRGVRRSDAGAGGSCG